MIAYSIVFYILPTLLALTHSICPQSCATCSSSTQCLTCAEQFYSDASSGALQCLPCPNYCLQCTSSNQCLQCIPPYSVSLTADSPDQICQSCEIPYSLTCSSSTSASSCESTYYLSDNYCLSCLLNCATCNSHADCQECISGYYLNTTVLTCNPCTAQHCQSCDQYTPTRCLTCNNGYQQQLDYSCSEIQCDIVNCKYCSSINQCAQCQTGYYWSSGACSNGASVLCEGAIGVFPNQCVQCSEFSYEVSTGIPTNGIENYWCKYYANVDSDSKRYYQLYYFAENDQEQLQSLFGSSASLSVQSTGEKSFLVSSSDQLSLSSLPSYYRITLLIKYRALTDIELDLTATTEQETQSENLTLSAASSPITATLRSTYVHSNNLAIAFSGQLYLIQLVIRLTKCPDDCYRCLNEEYCQMCNSPQYVSAYKCVDNCTIYYHYIQNRSCLSSCPTSFYPNSSIDTNTGDQSKYCQPCVSPCETCTSQTRCLSCVSGQYLASNSSCVTTCPATTFASDEYGTCETCISPCKQCTSPLDCTTCALGYYNGTDCTTQCPSGTFGNNKTHECENCKLPCTKCERSATKCTQCEVGKYYYDYGCYSECLERYYPDSSTMTCLRCVSPCLTCTSSTVCNSCVYNFLHSNSCLSICPSKFYSNVTSKICSACPTGCDECSSYSTCTKCSVGTCLLNGECISQCPYGQYYSLSDDSGYCSCEECNYPCKECTSSSICLSCLQGYLYEQQCRSLCPNEYYGDDTTFLCSLCSTKFSDCLQCSSSQCTRCSLGKTLYNGQCLDSCPDFHYIESQKCHKCIAPCLSCSSFTQCLSCVSPYILLSANTKTCMIQCPSSYVSLFQSITSTYECHACISPCASCEETTTNCTFCEYGYYLNSGSNGAQNECIQNCSSVVPVNTYFNEPITSRCTACMFPCKECKSETECLSCRIGYLNGYECKQCDNGFYEDSGICVACPTQCRTCFSPQYCIACNSGYYLYGFSCISDSSICTINGYYVLGTTCQLCQMPCKTCELTSTNCLSCVSGYIYYPSNSKKCITECPTGTYRSSFSCLTCHSYCETCSNSATYCFSCSDPYLLVLATMSCEEECPEKSYLQGKTCQACKYPCDSCLSQNECSSCLSGTLVGSVCLTSCPTGQFTNSSLMCEPCSFPCKECQGSDTSCTQCEDNYFLMNNECLVECPALYFGQTQAKQCLQCLGLCEQCSSHVNCTTCPNNLIYYFNSLKDYAQCVSECPISYYPASVNDSSGGHQECYPCLAQCLTCVNDSACELCADNKVQHQGSCYDQCPQTMYSSSGVCQSCSHPCYNCSDAFTCTACMDDSFLLVGSAECIIGETCPEGFYRITGTRLCNSQCPSGQYHQNNRTCSELGCDTDEYLGSDYFCYTRCPDGTKANEEYICKSCSSEEDCLDGLFYNLRWWIKADELYFGIQFTEQPILAEGQTGPNLQLLGIGDIQYTILSTSRRLLVPLLLTSSQSASNIVVQLLPQQSFSGLTLEVRFINGLSTFTNPLQRISKKLYLDGFDKYPSDLVSVGDFSIILGIFFLICALIGLVRNPYLTDFSQMIYVYGLINLHYPINFASFLESAYISHFLHFFQVDQTDSYSTGKFSYVTNLGLISNCLFNLILICVGLLSFLIVFMIYKGLLKSLNYNKVEEEEQAGTLGNEELAQPQNKQSKQVEESSSERKMACFRCLQKYFISNFWLLFLNRLIYINYFPLVIFTFGQLNVISFDQTVSSSTSVIASVVALPLMILLFCYPILLFVKIPQKPKFTFLIIRKIIVGIVVVLSRETPEYIIGVLAVISLMTGILIKAYSLEKLKIETKFLMSLQIAQFFIAIFLAIFVMIKSGTMTNGRLALSWATIILIVFTLLAYCIFEAICFVVWCFRIKTNRNLWQEWGLCDSVKEETEKGSSETDSNTQSFNSEKKQKGITAENSKNKTISLEKLLNRIEQQKENSKQNDKIPEPNSKKRRSHQIQNKFFWTYKDSEGNSQEQQMEDERRAPKMLIRCVNEFSDVDPDENKKEKEQKSDM